MSIKIYLILPVFVLIHLISFGQKKLNRYINHPGFEWMTDTLGDHVTLYFEKDSYADRNIQLLKTKIKHHLAGTIEFVGLQTYSKPIHYFILEDRQRMKLLVGYETNGNANPRNNFVAGIFSGKINSVFSNHELFHLIAMNTWGYGSVHLFGYDTPGCAEAWINEGMAVYSDDRWSGYDLHELSKYLIDRNAYISIATLSKRMRKFDARITYPVLGSFAKFIDETYGRETILKIWKNGRRNIKRDTGKSIGELEDEWLEMLGTKSVEGIQYPK